MTAGHGVDLLAETEARLLGAGLAAEPTKGVIARLRHEWGGERVYIHKVCRVGRDQEILRLGSLGVAPTDIAARMGCAVATVYRVQKLGGG